MARRLTALLLALLCIFGAAKAEAVREPVYGSTRAFAAMLEEAGIDYEARGVDAAEDSLAIMLGDCRMHCFFTAYGQSASFIVWYVISYDPAQETEVMLICSRLNASSDGPRFFADPVDCTVTAMLDVPLPYEAAGVVAYRGYLCMADMLPAALAALAPYDLSRLKDDAVEGEAIEAAAGENAVSQPEASVEEAAERVAEEPIASAATPEPAVTPAPQPVPSATPQLQVVIVTAESARIRSGPGVNSPYVCMVKQGDVLPVIGASGDWYIVRVEGRTGFLNMTMAAPHTP